MQFPKPVWQQKLFGVNQTARLNTYEYCYFAMANKYKKFLEVSLVR